ncbi:MAG: acyl-CoA dehydrogenase family protein [Pseudomonadales bacterium]
MGTDQQTHEIFNQAPDLAGTNLFSTDHTLQRIVAHYDGAWGNDALTDYGRLAGGELAEQGHLANRHTPELRTHDRYGRRIDVVEFHPAYHHLMRTAIAGGVHALPWSTPRPGAHVVRAALELLHNQADSGTDCPLTMTFASIPALRGNPELAALWEPGILSHHYDGRNLPYTEKRGLTLGMGMTEKQGGTDVRANTSRATLLNEHIAGGECAELTGHKWFCSAPMSDGFLTLAKLNGQLSCFLMPRWRPDGSRNNLYLQRLKDKLGNRSNASSELEFRDAFAWLIGEPGRGVAAIIPMVALTRFNCMVGSTAIMRQAVQQVINHIRHRSVSGKKLIDQPLMRNVAADLVLETEAALWLTFRVARALDHRESDPAEDLFVRLVTALGKYWICKRAPQHINEAQECLGGLGYVEEYVLPRLYREAPVNSIWEGSGNVQCLDVLRALQRSPESVDVLLQEIEGSTGAHRVFDQAVQGLRAQITAAAGDESMARIVVERMAILLQAALLLRHTNEAVSAAFVTSRLQPTTLAYGGITDAAAIAVLLQTIEPADRTRL